MQDIYHEGELMVQNRTGETAIAAQNANMISDRFSKGIISFLKTQQFAVLSSTDKEGKVWVTFLTGEPGFIEELDEHRVTVRARINTGDPLFLDTNEQKQIGLLIIDTTHRVRLRVNGSATLEMGQFIVTAQQIYGNCPKYIQRRDIRSENDNNSLIKLGHRSKVLSQQQQEWISLVDTFYIGSTNERGDMDASHRGGNPGFVHVINSKKISFPDYSGNSMYNTLGNIQSSHSAGLLFIDYDYGHSLQITGSAEIIWDGAAAKSFPGAERVVNFEIWDVVQLDNSIELRWEKAEMSPFNPKI